jgi:WD40 repeat protein
VGLRPGWGGGLLAIHPDRETVLHNGELWRLARDESRGPRAQEPSGSPQLAETGGITRAAYSADAQFAVTGRVGGLVQLWDLATGVPLRAPLPRWSAGANLSPDGTMLAGRVETRSCRVHDLTGKPLSPILTHPNQIGCMAFSPDSKLLAVGTYAWTVHLYEAATGKPHGKVLLHNDIVLSLAFSPDGKTLAAGSATDWNHAPQTQLWDVRTGKPVGGPLPQGGGNVRKLGFRPDGRALLACSEGQTCLWDVGTGKLIGHPIATSWVVPGAAFSPDGKLFLTGDARGQLRVRDSASAEPVGVPLAVSENVTATAFSPDAQTLLVGAADGTTQLWDVATLRPLGSPVVQRDRVLAVGWARDGRTFFTTTAGSPPRAWPVPAPLGEADLDTIAWCLEVLTTLRMDAGRAVSPLDHQTWRARRARWLQHHGSFDTVFGPPLGDAAWHGAQARQAEDDGNAHAACWHLDRLIRGRPGVPWLLYARRARAHAACGRFDQAAADAARAARAGSPRRVRQWESHQLGEFRLRGQWATALWYADRLIAAEPRDWGPYAERAAIRSALGDREGADADAARAVSLGAEADVLIVLADEAGRRQQWQTAAILYSSAREREPLPPWCWQRHAMALVKAGDQAGYRRSCTGLVRAAANGPVHRREMETLLRVCVLGPDAVDSYQPLFGCVDQLGKMVEPSRGGKQLVARLLGALLYRAGRHAEAAQHLKEGVGEEQQAGQAEAAFLAMAYHRLGKGDEARRWLAAATAAGPRDEAALNWNTLRGWLLCREAEALLGASPAK